jgi:regulator of cell morphogenesis and NO signaling
MIHAQQTIADIAANSFAAVRVFSKHGIDFCCGGQRPLGDVCQERRLDPGNLISELEQAIAGASAEHVDWTKASLRDLISHIVSRHHEYLRSELPRIQGWLDKVYSKYGEQDAASIGKLPQIFSALRGELEPHMQKEEVVLFPAIARLEFALENGFTAPAGPCGSFAGPIRVMEMEHEHAGDALKAMREVTSDYKVPEHACRTYRALFEGLQELEADLHVHIHLENNILFPRVQSLYA